MVPLRLTAVRRRRMTLLILLRGRCLFAYFRSDGPYSSVSPHAVVTVSMSPRTQACLNVVDAMPNSFDAAVSVQYLSAFFTCSNPAFQDSKMDGVHKIVTSRSVGSGGRPLPWPNISAIQEKSARKNLSGSFLLRRPMPPNARTRAAKLRRLSSRSEIPFRQRSLSPLRVAGD